MTTPPTYPARPVDGGRLDLAPPKPGTWVYEPKVNGWRVLVDLGERTMWNRYGERSTIEDKFTPVLDRLVSAFADSSIRWLDCEALERRLALGRGSLVVFDFADAYGFSYSDRRDQLRQLVARAKGVQLHDTLEDNQLYVLPAIRPFLLTDAQDFHDGLQETNKVLGVELYEGVVAKEVNSRYPMQLLSPSKETPMWTKHRWKY
jgi:ATP-dependent DNA ligase